MTYKTEYSNPFDDMGGVVDEKEAEKTAKDNEILFNRLDYLIHKIFEQGEDGKKLLDIWKESLMLSPGADIDSTSIDVGIREGKKMFIRNIILTVRRVENV